MTTTPQGTAAATPQGEAAPAAQTPPEPQGKGDQQAGTPQGGTAGTSTPDAPEDTVDGWKQTAQKWQNRAKRDGEALAELKKQLQGVLTPEQAEQTKQTAAEAERIANDARMEAMRLRVALRMSLPEDWADRLRGDTEDDLVADAKKLAQYIPKGETPPPPKPGVPDAGAATGRRPKPETPDLNSLLRTMAGR